MHEEIATAIVKLLETSKANPSACRNAPGCDISYATVLKSSVKGNSILFA